MAGLGGARRAGRAGRGWFWAALVSSLPLVSGAGLPLPAVAQPSGPQAPDLTAPPVLDPRKVETQPLAPATSGPFTAREITLTPVPVLILSGESTWDEAYDTLKGAFKTLEAERQRLGLKRAGDDIVMYVTSDERGFTYETQLPFSGVTTQKPEKGVRLGASYAGKMLAFNHAGSFADMDNTYEQIANYLDDKNIDAKDLYIERYHTDLLTNPPEALEIEVLVPVP